MNQSTVYKIFIDQGHNPQNPNAGAEANGVRDQDVTYAANSWGADYFISLHCNASTVTTASGSEAYVYSVGSAAYYLGEQILAGLNYATGLPNRGVRTNPSLYVLRRTRMPAVLVEMGYLTNPYDAALLSSDPQSFARGIYSGILDYLNIP